MNKYSYVTLLTDDSFIFGVMLLHRSLKDVESKYPLEVLVTSNVSLPILNILEQLNINYQIIEPVRSEQMLMYNAQIYAPFAKNCELTLTKFEIFNLIQFDKIVFLDADVMVLKNIDHVFDCPHLTSALDGEYFNIWPDEPHFNAGIIVIEPNVEEYEKIKEFSIKCIDTWDKPQCIADQEILNQYYKDWPNKTELHLNKYYDVFAPYIQEEDIKDIEENAYFIHFIGRKPWRSFFKPNSETYTEYFYDMAHDKIQEIADTLDWTLAQKQIKLAVYGICKDEIQNIEKYINCFNKADYLCILDTGSTDGTWEYLQKAKEEYPNLIIEQKVFDPWRYDTARNYSLTLVPEDTTMYFMVDLDEIIKDDGWVELIKSSWDPIFSRRAYTYNRRVDPVTNNIIQQFIECRIHSKTWHYSGLVHEQLYDTVGQRGFNTDECTTIPMVVWHYPLNPNRESYIELCERAIEEQPNNWVMHLQLAAEYEVHSQWDKAITEYRKIIAEQEGLALPEIGRCYASLGRILGVTDKKEEGLNVFKKGRATIPNCADNYFLAAEILFSLKEYKETFELCYEGLKNGSINEWCTIVSIDSYYPYLLMGMSQYFLENKIEAMGYVAIAREKNPSEEISSLFSAIMNEITNRG